MIANLGRVQFSINKLNFNKLNETLSYNWTSQNLLNGSTNFQITGFSKTRTIGGTFYPYHHGGLEQKDNLEKMADKMEPELLTITFENNRGKNLGYWVIDEITFNSSKIILQPQKIEFQISLQYYGHSLSDSRR